MAIWDRKPKPEPTPIVEERIVSASGAVVLQGDNISANVSNVSEARVAIKECRSFKKELTLQKREVNAVMADIRAARRLAVGSRGSMMRGVGSFGSFVRSMDRLGRDLERSSHSRNLAPYEELKSSIDSRIRAFDNLILQLERIIVKYEQDNLELTAPTTSDSPSFCRFCGVLRLSERRFCSQCGAPF